MKNRSLVIPVILAILVIVGFSMNVCADEILEPTQAVVPTPTPVPTPVYKAPDDEPGRIVVSTPVPTPTPEPGTVLEHNTWNWMDGLEFSRLKEFAIPDTGVGFPPSYTWVWETRGSAAVSKVVLGTSRGGTLGHLYLNIPLDLTAYQETQNLLFSFNLTPTNGCASGGVGLTLFAIGEDGLLNILEGGKYGTNVQETGRMYPVSCDLTEYAGKKISLLLLFDNNGNSTGPDKLTLQTFKLAVDNRTAQHRGDWKGITMAFLPNDDFADFRLQVCGAKSSFMYNRLKRGYDPSKHIFSAIEDSRPVMSAHVYLTDGFGVDFSILNDLFDCIQTDQTPVEFDFYGVPWVNVSHPAIPMGLSDTNRLNSLRSSIPSRIEQFRNRFRFFVGATMGSEPHTNPDRLEVANPNKTGYTGHSLTQLQGWGVEGESAKEFGNWMGSLYGTGTPSAQDQNGNSFYKDFGYTANSWQELAIKPNTEHEHYLRTIFREYGVGMGIKATDDLYGSNAFSINYTSRLLSNQRRPFFAQSVRQMEIPTKAVGSTYYARIDGSKRYEGASELVVYDPAQTEFRGSYMYQMGLKDGRRTVYNEFNVNDVKEGHPFGRNTPGSVYRGYFGELQFKPANINWFSYAVGNKYASFQRYDLRPYEAYIAMIRSHLELGRVYAEGEFKREKRDLGIFIPVAAPSPIGWELGEGALTYHEILPLQVELFGPDVFPNNRHDKMEEYDNNIIVLGYIEGPTDSFLTEYLQNIPEGKKVMIIASSSELYCEPGKRASGNFTRSLKEVLPISPDGNGGWRQDKSDTIPQNKLLDDRRIGLKVNIGESKLGMVAAKNIYKNEAVASGGTIYKDSDGKDAAWVSKEGNLLVLSGIPTNGLQQLIEEFFNLHPADVREAGTHMTVNYTLPSHTAQKAGWYSIDRNQTLHMGEDFVGYDMVKRKMAGEEGILGETVVRVLDKKSFAVIDAGTAYVELKTLEPDKAVIYARVPTFPFDELELGRHITPEFVFYSPWHVSVDADGEKLEPVPMGNGFYSLPIEKNATYTFVAEATE